MFKFAISLGHMCFSTLYGDTDRSLQVGFFEGNFLLKVDADDDLILQVV